MHLGSIDHFRNEMEGIHERSHLDSDWSGHNVVTVAHYTICISIRKKGKQVEQGYSFWGFPVSKIC